VKPAPSRGGVLGQTLRYSIPLALGVAAVALPVYLTSLANGASAEVSRTMVTTVSSLMGIGALILIPVAADDEGRVRMPAWMRTVLLVVAMVFAYLVVLSVPLGRSFFQLTPLPAEIVATLGVIAAAWTLAVLFIHRTRIVQRAIDVLIDASAPTVTRVSRGLRTVPPISRDDVG